MNLIQQLKQTPKWSEFKQWWNDQYEFQIEFWYEENASCFLIFTTWCDFPFEMQSDVFKKFIESDKDYRFIVINYLEPFELHSNEGLMYKSNKFEELILWYFNK